MASPAPQLPPDDFDPADYEERAGELPVGRMTFAEYLAFDESSQARHEYVDGLVYAMGYGTSDHGVIAMNLAAITRGLARGTQCRAYSSTVRVLTPRRNSYVPDVVAYCGPRHPGASLYHVHPCFIVEVLSPSTRNVDLNEKLEHYREIETLRAYWIIEATWRCVHRHWRDAGGVWQYEEVVGDGVLPVPCPVEMTLTLDDVYEDVDVPREPPEPPPEPPRPLLRRVREPDAAYAAADAVAHPG